ncbi:8-oxoguanine deaminase [Parvibaculum sp.]|uniref:8-oxoguanine deaminase n=1 Tax=Parvibaculum sp. TaxID=2024848 RepID=UPI003210B866
MRTWLRDPISILAEGAERGVVVEDGRIVELVGHDGPSTPYDQTFDAGRHVVLPGLINTHHHFFQTLTRAHPQAINKELFPWLKSLYPIWADHLNRDSFRLATRVALTEMLMSGCTTASDHLFVFPADMPDAVDIEAEEASKLGMRMTLTRGAINFGTKNGGIADERLMQDYDAVLADCERVLGKYHDRSEGSYLQVALAPCAPFNVTKQLMVDSATLAEKHDCRLHTHLGETLDEDDFCISKFGMRPLDYLEEVGWLNSRVWLAHGIHFDDEEVVRLGRHKVGVCHCPTSNMVLASGTCRTKDLEAAGAIVGLGVDGSASNDSSNLMEAVRHAMMLGRLSYGAAAVTHHDALRWATEGSAACLGRTDIGKIEVGRQADLALFTLDELRFSGAGDPIAALVLCGAHHADRVMIGGEWRVTDGQPVGLDIARLRHEHGEAAKAFLKAV